MRIGRKEFSTIAVVDDEESSRESLGWMLSDAGLKMHAPPGPLQAVGSAHQGIVDAADALICDHRLSVRNYARFQGAELVAESIREGFPAILCTRCQGTDIDSIRPMLPNIPVMLRWDELNEPEQLWTALGDCTEELSGNLAPERRRWRSQLVVERVNDEDGTFDVYIPAWELEELIRLRLNDLPEALKPRVQEGFRTHAQVNLGAQTSDRLFVTEWEFDGC